MMWVTSTPLTLTGTRVGAFFLGKAEYCQSRQSDLLFDATESEESVETTLSISKQDGADGQARGLYSEQLELKLV